MSRLIAVDVYKKRIERYPPEIRNIAKKELRYTPTVDAVEVVRCKDCKHSEEAGIPDRELWCNIHEIFMTAYYFCAEGEKKE